MSTLVVGPFYLAGGLGLAPAGIGLVMTSGPVSMIVGVLILASLPRRTR
ncbi:hypothetical protein [Myceligenerans halotolerans]